MPCVFIKKKQFRQESFVLIQIRITIKIVYQPGVFHLILVWAYRSKPHQITLFLCLHFNPLVLKINIKAIQLKQGGVDELNAFELALAACPRQRWANLQVNVITVRSYSPNIFLLCLGQMPFTGIFQGLWKLGTYYRYHNLQYRTKAVWALCAISKLK